MPSSRKLILRIVVVHIVSSYLFWGILWLVDWMCVLKTGNSSDFKPGWLMVLASPVSVPLLGLMPIVAQFLPGESIGLELLALMVLAYALPFLGCLMVWRARARRRASTGFPIN